MRFTCPRLVWFGLWSYLFFSLALEASGLNSKRDVSRMIRPLSFWEKVSESNEARHASMKLMLSEYIKVLNASDITWWLDLGTYLGQWREGTFLEVTQRPNMVVG